jgi:hypothetical protein
VRMVLPADAPARPRLRPSGLPTCAVRLRMSGVREDFANPGDVVMLGMWLPTAPCHPVEANRSPDLVSSGA